jgi:hypothetical protein
LRETRLCQGVFQLAIDGLRVLLGRDEELDIDPSTRVT